MNIGKVCTHIAIGLTADYLSKLISLKVGINVGKENGKRNGNNIVLILGITTIPAGGGAGKIMHKILCTYKMLAKNRLNKKKSKRICNLIKNVEDIFVYRGDVSCRGFSFIFSIIGIFSIMRIKKPINTGR